MKSPVDCSSTSTSTTTRSGPEPGSARHADSLEVVQISQPPLGAIDQALVVSVAFRNLELAAYHVSAGAGVALDIDSFDVGSGSLLDYERNIDALACRVPGDARSVCAKGKPSFESSTARTSLVLSNARPSNTRSWPSHQQAPQFFRVQPGHVADYADLTEVIKLTFID